MRIRPLRLLTVFTVLLALLLPATATARARDAAPERGVVQSLNARHIVLTALDGTTVSFVLLPRTQVRLDGVPARAADVLPGFVAEVRADARNRVILLRAFSGNAPTTIDRGTVTAVTKTSVTIAPESGGPALTSTIDRLTKVRLRAGSARKDLLRPGALVAVTHISGGPALVITILKRAGA